MEGAGSTGSSTQILPSRGLGGGGGAVRESRDRFNLVQFANNKPIWKCFKRIPTKVEWSNFRKYTRRMHKLKISGFDETVSLETLLALQFHTTNEHFLPRLRVFKCGDVGQHLTSFIPFFLSSQITYIHINFSTELDAVGIASIISRFPTLCPNLERIVIAPLEISPVITDVVSSMLLASRGSLRTFCVRSPLTKEAQDVVYRLPNLSQLRVVIQEHIPLPPIKLPNLVSIYIIFDVDHSWLEAFRGAPFEKLDTVIFRSESGGTGDFLEAFERVALTTSIRYTLSTFKFSTLRAWTPNYHPLLSFNKLSSLEIYLPCVEPCSSGVGDDVIAAIARAMPKLEVLRLGGTPCQAVTGATVKRLIEPSSRCPRLSELRIHFQAGSLVDAARKARKPLFLDDGPVDQPEDCALKILEVGETPIPLDSARSVPTIALFLLQIFPRIISIEFDKFNLEWEQVAETLQDFRQFGAYVRRKSE